MNPITSEATATATEATLTSRAAPEPFTWGALAGVGGASAAVTTISGTLSAAFDWQYPRWLPLLLALVIVVVADFAVRRDELGRALRNPSSWLLWTLNACLVFMTAVGGTRLVAGSEPTASDETNAAVDARASSAIAPREAEPAQPAESARSAESSVEPSSSPPAPTATATESVVAPPHPTGVPRPTHAPASPPPHATSVAETSGHSTNPSPPPKPATIEAPAATATHAAPREAEKKIEPSSATAAPAKPEAKGFRRLGNISLF